MIPTLLLKDSGLVKGVNFKKHRYVGDPINAVKNRQKIANVYILFGADLITLA